MAGLRYSDIRDDLLRKLGIESAGSASAGMLADVLAAMNFAQQQLRLAGPDYFTRSAIDVTLVEGTAIYDLDDDVQDVLGPVRLPNGRTLRALESRSELDNFALLYLGKAGPIMDDDEPCAYFVEGLAQTGNDPGKLRLHVVPAPDGESAGAAVVEGVIECATIATGDLASTTVFPVPQQYAESLFLPIARRHLLSSTYFSAQNLEARILADAEEAMRALGMAGGFPPEKRRDDREVAA